ncbi:FecR family protein [Flavobacterium pectinovorum]|uniref:FecR family protein n=1 Tax=Flavobacterium pectinovorum TaxID=29533 RepID=UPI001FACC412|nr:FecR family protein [Flavobacterium pectinovorum]MCI9846843.1 FecR family protein [Flavobacterium pectinovorum]
MSNFSKIVLISKELAASILRNEEPHAFKNSDLFDENDKQYILEHLTKEHINQRRKLISQIDINKDLKKVHSKINVPVRKIYNWRYASAAAVILLLASTYFFKDTLTDNPQQNVTVAVKSRIEPGTDKAVLVLANGEKVTLGNGVNYAGQNVKSNNEQIFYNNSNSSKNATEYNYLIVPRGGNFSINLADGTKVWLNSESKLKFPVAFSDGEERKVDLIYGEAYFDVSPSTRHKGSHFKVHHDKQEVEVVGTEFNIKAYNNESHVYTTLVEGKVAVSSGGKKVNLVPNQQFNMDLTTSTFKISNVDVSRSIAWKEGVFYFEDESIENILRTMSRWYDFEYRFKSETLKNSRFTGLIKKRKNLEDILNIISRTSNIKYSINSKNNVNEVIISSK